MSAIPVAHPVATTVVTTPYIDKDEPAFEHVEETSESLEKVEEPMQRSLAALALVAAQESNYSAVKACRLYWRPFLWAMFISLGAFMGGYDSQSGGAILSVPSFRRNFGAYIDNQYILSAAWQSGFNSCSQLGQMFGGLTLGYISDKFGRKAAIAIASCISIVGIFLQFFTPPEKNPMLLVGKMVNGYAIGLYISCASNYAAEVSPLPIRGITTGGVNFWVVIGQFMSNCVIQGTGNRTDQYAYRIPFAVQWIFPAIILSGLPFAPESPWWLVRKGRLDLARKAVINLLGTSTDPDRQVALDPDLQVQLIKDTIELEDRDAVSATYLDLFRAVNRRRTMIAGMVFVLQSVVGVSFVLGFSTYFFELAGFADSKAFGLGVGTLGLAIVGNLLGLYFINRVGRRPIYNWGMVACTVDTLLIGILSLPNRTGTNWAMAIFTMFYMLAFQAGIGPVAYAIYSEVSTARLRSKTVGFGIWINAFCGLISNIYLPYLVNPNEANLGGKVGFLFAGMGILGTAWSWFFIPETSGRTVDEIDALFALKVPPRMFKTYRLENVDKS